MVTIDPLCGICKEEQSCTFGCPQEDTGADLSPSEDSGMPYFDAEGNSGTLDEALS